MNENFTGKRKMSVKLSLYLSMISLVLCCAMLFTTTYAWFTISIEMPETTIQAGFLSFEVLKYDDTNAESVVVENTDTESLFPQIDAWSPTTAPQSVTLSVKNTGSLPMKYAMYLRIKSSLSGNEVLANGGTEPVTSDFTGKLENALCVTASTDVTAATIDTDGNKIVNKPFGTATVTTAISGKLIGTKEVDLGEDAKINVSETRLIGAVSEPIAWGEMPAAVTVEDGVPNCPETDKITITIHMAPETDETFQHGRIIFDIVIVATQIESENVPLVISTSEGLTTAAANGNTAVYLFSQRDATDETTANTYVIDSIGSLKKLIGQTIGENDKPEITLTLKESSYDGIVFTSVNPDFVTTGTGTTTVSNCTFGSGRAAGGFTIQSNNKVSFENCNFDAKVSFAGTKSNYSFKNCRISGELLTKENIAGKLGSDFSSTNIAN